MWRDRVRPSWSWGIDDERERDRAVSRTMADEYQGFAPADFSGAHAKGAGTVAGHLAAGPRLGSPGNGGGSGVGPTHHWPMGSGLWRRRTQGLDFRTVRGFSLALGQEEQAELRAAVQELPGTVGIGLANWNWKVVRQFVSERFGISRCRSSCLNYPRLHESRLCQATARTSMPMRPSGVG